MSDVKREEIRQAAERRLKRDQESNVIDNVEDAFILADAYLAERPMVAELVAAAIDARELCITCMGELQSTHGNITGHAETVFAKLDSLLAKFETPGKPE